MELDWRNRCVGGERLEDLLAAVHELGAGTAEELVDMLEYDRRAALPFHRALLRLAAEVLWERAAQLRPATVMWPDFDWLVDEALAELARRSDIEILRSFRFDEGTVGR